MKKLSGLVLDVYDDAGGQVLKQIFETREAVPEFIKSAHYLAPEEQASLPDDVFALVLKDGDVSMRKYACTDPGNTALAVEYFLREGHKLPEEAQKTAAANLQVACEWYGLPPNHALEKVAIGALLGAVGKGAAGLASKVMKNPMSALGTAMTGLSVVQAGQQAKAALHGVNAAEAQQGFGNLVRPM